MPMDRRDFLMGAGAMSALAVWPFGCATLPRELELRGPRRLDPARVRGAFFYPPAQVVLEGRCEDGWSRHKWFTWPGNQYEPEKQQAKFTAQVSSIVEDMDLEVALDEPPLYTDAGIQAFIGGIRADPPDALLLFNFWNSFSGKLVPILEAFDGPVILYHPVGANHQLPPARLREAKRVRYIHSIENFEALARGLRAVHAGTRMARSRLLRVSGRLKEEADAVEPLFGTAIHGVPAKTFNDIFDATPASEATERVVRAVRERAEWVRDLEDPAFVDAARAHFAVQEIMERYDADAITIECLFLKHRKPCLSFSLNNGALIPSGCENDLNASLTLMLGAHLFGRGGFQHNPDFDTEQNLYFGSHCTCATRLHGPQGERTPYGLRPFFHQLPKTLALDVQWPVGEAVTLCKYNSARRRLDAWMGDVIGSPTCPPAGGCATRVLVRMRAVPDVCSVYPGPHPVLYCGEFGELARDFARLYDLELHSNERAV